VIVIVTKVTGIKSLSNNNNTLVPYCKAHLSEAPEMQVLNPRLSLNTRIDSQRGNIECSFRFEMISVRFKEVWGIL